MYGSKIIGGEDHPKPPPAFILQNCVYAQGKRSFEQYDEICKYFTEGKQRDNDANEIQKHLQLYDLSLGNI